MKKLYLYEDLEHEQWCGVTSKSAWPKSAFTLAVVEYSGERISALHIIYPAESGDWIVYDDYYLGRKEQILRLERRLDFAAELRSQLQKYVFKSGKAVLVSTSSNDIKTRTAIPNFEIQGPEIQIVIQPTELPFWSLVGKRRSEILSKGIVCVSTMPEH